NVSLRRTEPCGSGKERRQQSNICIARNRDLAVSQAACPVDQQLIAYQKPQPPANSPEPVDLGLIASQHCASKGGSKSSTNAAARYVLTGWDHKWISELTACPLAGALNVGLETQSPVWTELIIITDLTAADPPLWSGRI